VTKNAADDRAGADEAIVFSPISVPDEADRARGRRRRRLLAGAAAVVVVAGGITAWAVAASGGDSKPAKHTAVIPQAFGAYTEAKPGDTEWTQYDAPNTDIAKGQVYLTYRAAGDRAAKVNIRMDPSDYVSDDGTHHGPGSVSSTMSLLAVNDMSVVHSYPAGKAGGKIQCADIRYQNIAITRCAWQSDAADITYVPVVKHVAVADRSAPADFRAFLDALTIKPLKG
jgi:hypothetical protein